MGSEPAGFKNYILKGPFHQLEVPDQIYRDPDDPWDAYFPSQEKLENRGRGERGED